MRHRAASSLLACFVVLLACAAGQQCPRRGEAKRADPRNAQRYLHCYDGRSRWRYCPDGQAFDERRQACVPDRSSKSESSPSEGSSQKKNDPAENESSNSDSRNGVSFDYHW